MENKVTCSLNAMPQLREITLVDGLLNADRSRQSRQTSMKGVR